MNDIWMYWESLPGRGMPPFVQLCIDSVRRHAGQAKLHLLDQHSIHAFLPGLRPEWAQLEKPAHKADYVRTRLTLRYGGMWLDCDMVALRNLEPLLDIPPPFDFACQDVSGAIGCFVAKPGCGLLERITAAQDEVLDTHPHGFSWNAIGNDLLALHGSDYPCHRWPKWTVDEIAGGKVSKLLSESETVQDNVDANAAVFHCCGNLLSPLLDRYARHRQRSLLRQGLLLSKIVRAGLGVPEPKIPARWTEGAWIRDAGEGVMRKLSKLRSEVRG